MHIGCKLVYSESDLSQVINHVEMVEWEVRDPDFIYLLRTRDGQLFEGRIGVTTHLEENLSFRPSNPLVIVEQREGVGRQGLRPVIEFVLPKTRRLFPMYEWNRRMGIRRV
jgi:hypothetical protein